MLQKPQNSLQKYRQEFLLRLQKRAAKFCNLSVGNGQNRTVVARNTPTLQVLLLFFLKFLYLKEEFLQILFLKKHIMLMQQTQGS
jgi:hypothetical protein